MKSDRDLTDEIRQALQNDPQLEIEFLDVRVLNGVVTLAGSVTSDPEKWMAEDSVRRVRDVTELVSNLQVIEKPADLRSADAARPWLSAGG